MQNILLYSSLFSTETCQSPTTASIRITNSFCSREVNGAAVFFATLTTSSTLTTLEVFTSLRNWFQSGPALFFSGIPFEVDLECGLLIQEDPIFECPSNATSPSTGPILTTASIVIISFFTLLAVGLLIVIIALSVLYIRTRRKKKESPHPPAHFLRYEICKL